MPLYNFELLYQAELTEQQTYDEYELLVPSDPYDPYLLWDLVFEDEIPEFIYTLVYYDEIESFSIISDISSTEEEYILDYNETYDPSFYYFPIDTEIHVAVRTWDLKMEDYFYDLSMMLWVLSSVEEFLITFPFYWLHSQTFFDFGDVSYNPNYIRDMFEVQSPLLYLVQVFEEPFGDITFSSTPIMQEAFLSYLNLVFTLVFSTEILPSVPTVYTLLNTDNYPNISEIVTSWRSVWSDTEVTIWWSIVFGDSIVPDPNIKCMVYKLRDTERFIVFALINEDTFDVTFSTLSYFDDMGDITEWSLIDSYSFPFLANPYIRVAPFTYTTESGLSTVECDFVFLRDFEKFDARWRPERLHMYSMKSWQDKSFDSYFDFQDFDCRVFTVDDACSARIQDNFDLEIEFEITFIPQIEDEFEALTEFIDIDFRRVLTDEFYDFDVFYKGDYDTFDFKYSFNFYNENNNLEQFSYSIDVLWREAPEPDDNFALDFRDYVLYTNDQTTFYIDRGNTYGLVTEDGFDDTLIVLETVGIVRDDVSAGQ